MEKSIVKVIEDNIEKHKDNISAQDFRFYQLEKVISIVRTLEKSGDCSECQEGLKAIENFIENLPETLNDKEQRIKFNETLQEQTKHLRQKHKYYLPKFYTYTYSFIGMFSGLMAGLIVILIQSAYNRIFIMFTAWFAGIIIGRIIGFYKDKAIKESGHQL